MTTTTEEPHDNPGIVGAVAGTANRLISSLPAQFLVLCLVNLVFVMGLLWFVDREQQLRAQVQIADTEARARVIGPVLTACIAGLSPPAEHH